MEAELKRKTRLVFHRHATSKLDQDEDLFHIQ